MVIIPDLEKYSGLGRRGQAGGEAVARRQGGRQNCCCNAVVQREQDARNARQGGLQESGARWCTGSRGLTRQVEA